MPKVITWKTKDIEEETSQGLQIKRKLHSTHYCVNEEHGFEPIVCQCIDKATNLLPENLTDDSRYLMFEWRQDTKELSIVVTDDSKSNDSQHITQCKMTVINYSQNADELSQSLRECIHNYLTTCSEFMQFSLIAVYHDSTRANSTLL